MSERELFVAALHLRDATRVAFLEQACGGDLSLRNRIESLLHEHERLGSYLEPSPKPNDATVTHSEAHAGKVATDRLGEIPGTVIAGRYKLIDLIGEGGMGSVWRAQQSEPVKRSVAIKLIKAGMDSKAVLARFEAERQALAVMDHPNIAKILDGGVTESGSPYFVMELVKGVPITQFCDEQKLTPRQRLELFIPVCQAIQHAHQKGIIHRDIKPSNVLIAMYDERPVPKVIDFGIAKATGSTLTDQPLLTGFGAVVGTPEYMSPEQASLNNLDVDTRSDVYSLGVLLYELLTGTTPVDRNSLGKAALLEVLRIVREVDAPKLSTKLSGIKTIASVAANRSTEPEKLSHLMKGDLDWVVLRALEKDRNRRYETAVGLACDIQRYLADEMVEARSPTLGYRLRKAYRKHRTATWAASAFVILILGAATMGFALAMRARQAEQEAMIARDRALEAELIQAERAQAEQQAREQAVLETQKARKQTEIAEAVRSFLEQDLIAQVNPLDAGQSKKQTDPELKLKTALDQAEKQIASRFQGKPRIEASIRRALGKAYLGRGMFPEATKQLELACAGYRDDLASQLQSDLDNHDYIEALFELVGLSMMSGKMAAGIPVIELLRAQILLMKDTDVEKQPLLESLSAMREMAEGKEASALVLKNQSKIRKLLGQPTPDEAPKNGKTKESGEDPFHDLNRFTEAMKLMASEKFPEAEIALSRLIKSKGNKEGPNELIWKSMLGEIQRLQGKNAEARTTFESCRDGLRKMFGEDHPSLLACQISLAKIYLHDEKFEQAENELRAVLKFYDRRMPDDPGRFESTNQLGIALLGQKKYAAAEPLLLAAYEGWNSTAAKKIGLNIRLPEAIDPLIKLFTETNKPDELKKWRLERAKYPNPLSAKPEKK